MKKALSLIIIGLVVFMMSHCTPATETPQETVQEEVQASAITQVESKPDSVLRHVVLFKFKEDADPAAIVEAEEAFVALPSKIPQILDFEWGMNNSPEGVDKGMTHCYLLTFKSEEDRAIYLPHPDHKAFVALLDNILGDVVVVDYWAK